MASVFIPVTFITGSSGVFYKQFGVTLAIAIILSAVNALTLSPALAAIFLKPKNQEQKTHSVQEDFLSCSMPALKQENQNMSGMYIISREENGW